MPNLPATLYAGWRHQALAGPMLHDGGSPPPPERLLQAIWHHQRLCRDQLLTLDGRRLQVLHPGFWNHEAGPDFQGAVLQFDADPPCTGDVEIDLRPGDWRGHGHERNPAFRKVALHVVWEGAEPSLRPTLALRPLLDSQLSELGEWLTSEAAHEPPPTMAGRCAAHWRELPAEHREELLRQAALCRLQSKASRLAARARQTGWEQSLLEGLFRALGYKHNAWPMQRLAEIVARCRAEDPAPAKPLVWQARLLGVAGLLPSDLTSQPVAPDSHFRRLWDVWWRERAAFEDSLIPREAWRFHGLRPSNHPQRRLALAGHWLARRNLFADLERWFLADLEGRAAAAALLEVLQAPADDFWCRHWTLNSPRLPKPQPLLGAARLTDLAMNAVLPWLWVRAVSGGNGPLRARAEACYLGWPPAEDNAVLRLARMRLLNGAAPRSLHTAAQQQGLLQVTRDFCDQSNALCDGCPFPGLLRSPVAINQAEIPR